MTEPRHEQEIVPQWSMHPGALLRQILEKKGIRQSELAERTGLTPKHVNQLVKESIGISGDVALRLERALGFNAQFWLRAEADYQAFASKQKAEEKLPEYVPWARKFDAPTLRHHGVLNAGDDAAITVEKILRFFGVATPEAFVQTWQRPRVSFRRSQAFAVVEQNTALWLRLVERSAEKFVVPPLRIGALRAVARTLPGLTTLTVPDGFAAARTALAEAGVVLTFIRQVPDTRVCGATWWLGSDRPVIGLTERHRKPDIFWFNLLHEVGHIILHPKRTTFLDIEGERDSSDTAEQEADTFAEDTLIPLGARAQISRATTREQLLLLAGRLGLGISIVAGQHGHLTDRWNIGGALRGKITDEDVKKLEEISNEPLASNLS